MTYCNKSLFLMLALVLSCIIPNALHAADDPHVEVRVSPQDTLIGLARQLLANPAEWPRLQTLNQIENPQILQPGSLLKIPVSMLRGDALQARVESVRGQVLGKGGPLQAGALMSSHDTITTGANSYALIVLPDESRVRIRAETHARIEELQRLRVVNSQQSRIEVSKGRIETQVKPQRGPAARYEIRTPTAVIGVRGTDFRAGFDGTASRIEVTEGRVAANQDTLLTAGQGAIVDARGLRTAKLLPAPLVTNIPQLFEQTLVRLPLPETSGAAAHRVIVAGAAGFDLPVAEQIVSGSEARIAGLPDGEYQLRLRAINADGLEGLDSETSFRLKARPEPPFASADRSGGKFLENKLTFSWTKQSEAARYRMQVAGAEGFDQPVFQADDLETTQQTLQLSPGNYQWRLASVRANGDRGPWGPAIAFSVKSAPAAPGAVVIGKDTISLSWPSEKGQRFEISLGRDPAFFKIVSEHTSTEAQLTLPKPEAGEYFIRVRATDPDGFVGQWSEPRRFVIEETQPWWLMSLPLLLFAL